MGGVCWVFPRVALLVVTTGKSVDRHGGPVMAAPPAEGSQLVVPRSER